MLSRGPWCTIVTYSVLCGPSTSVRVKSNTHMSDDNVAPAAPAMSAGPSEAPCNTPDGTRLPGASPYGSGQVYGGRYTSAQHHQPVFAAIAHMVHCLLCSSSMELMATRVGHRMARLPIRTRTMLFRLRTAGQQIALRSRPLPLLPPGGIRVVHPCQWARPCSSSTIHTATPQATRHQRGHTIAHRRLRRSRGTGCRRTGRRVRAERRAVCRMRTHSRITCLHSSNRCSNSCSCGSRSSTQPSCRNAQLRPSSPAHDSSSSWRRRTPECGAQWGMSTPVWRRTGGSY